MRETLLIVISVATVVGVLVFTSITGTTRQRALPRSDRYVGSQRAEARIAHYARATAGGSDVRRV